MKANEIFVYSDTNDFINCDQREFADRMAEVIRLGLIRDASFYEWLILNFNEIMDKDVETIEILYSKVLNIKSFFEAKDPEGIKEGKALLYGKSVAKALNGNINEALSNGEFEGLGMIAMSYIAYKREMLSMEEFYEIRDMFVPFGLTISVDNFDVEKIIDLLYSDHDFLSELENMPLLKRIGKICFVGGVTKDEIKDALSSLIVEWD